MKSLVVAFMLGSVLFSCQNTTNTEDSGKLDFLNRGHELVHKSVLKMGDYSKLLEKHDVQYTYTYTTPDGKIDESTEKYIFKNELSYGAYHTHERTLPQLEGLIEQGYDGKEYWFKHNGEILKDSAILKGVVFNRHTNFYWFAMMQKLLDPGLNYEYLGEIESNNKLYDIVKVGFDSPDNRATDIYQVYINRQTSLINQFLFTVADYGLMEKPFLMSVEYEEIEQMLIPTQRKYKRSTWDADVTDDPWIEVIWSNIKFNNGLTPSEFQKDANLHHH